MNLVQLGIALKMPNTGAMLSLTGHGKSIIALHFLGAAFESGLLDALAKPGTLAELVERLNVKRPELLDALLETGVVLGELGCKNGVFSLKGRLAKTLGDPQGDAVAAVVQSQIGYYNDIFRHLPARLSGAPLSDELDEIGEIVARLATLTEPFMAHFLKTLVRGNDGILVLDVGCGAGAHLHSVAKANPTARGAGIDVDPKVVAQAIHNLEQWGIADKFQVHAANVLDPPPGMTGPYDLITLNSVIYYFSKPERGPLLEGLKTLLAPGGKVALSSMFQKQGRDLMAANLDTATRSMIGCHPLPELKALQQAFAQSGYTDIKTKRLMPGGSFFSLVGTRSD